MKASDILKSLKPRTKRNWFDELTPAKQKLALELRAGFHSGQVAAGVSARQIAEAIVEACQTVANANHIREWVAEGRNGTSRKNTR